MPEEQDGAPEANQSKAAEMVEMIRQARSIVETGWPMPAEGNPEMSVYDAIQRSNLISGVVGILMEDKRGAWSAPMDWASVMDRVDYVSGRIDGQADALSEVLRLQKSLYAEMETQTTALGEVTASARMLFNFMKVEAEKAGR